MLIILWIVSIIATVVIAQQKKLGAVGYFFFALFTGPLALIVAVIVSPHNGDKGHNVQDAHVKKEFTIQDAQNELEGFNMTVAALQQKIADLQSMVDKLSQNKSSSYVEPRVNLQLTPNVGYEKKIEQTANIREIKDIPAQASDMELDFGRNWLNKIGIVIFTLGMGFLISYTFKYFGPFMKILFGYFVGGILFFFGFKLEVKEKFVNFGRVLLGGAWALVYFTTYAMHHFEASRIIDNQMVDLILLAAVAIGMMAHVFKYKSEGMMSVALFVAYITTTLGHITIFTFISCLFLAAAVLFLVYNFQWVKTFILGIVLTYGIHFVWVMPNMESSLPQNIFVGTALLNLIFLIAYWLVFLAGIHIAKTFKDPLLVNILAAVNFGNIALYSILSYPLVLDLYYGQRFLIVLAEGIVYLALALWMKKIGREKLYVSDLVAAVFAITFAVSLKFLPTSSLILWLIEVPCLLFIGVTFKEKVFRYLSYGLSGIVALRMIFLCAYENMPDIHVLSFLWTWKEFMSLVASISMGACFYLLRRLKAGPEKSLVDEIFEHIFPAASFVYLTTCLYSMVHQPWVSLILSTEGLALIGVAYLLNLKRFRVYSYLVLGLSAMIFLTDDIMVSNLFLKWFMISVNVFVFFAVYFILKYLKQTKRMDPSFDSEEMLPFWAGIGLLVYVIFQYIHSQWISLSLGIAGVALILMGILNKDKIERLGGLILFGLTLGRVVFVDLAGLDIIFKIITFIILGVLFVGISFIYNRFNFGQEKDKRTNNN